MAGDGPASGVPFHCSQCGLPLVRRADGGWMTTGDEEDRYHCAAGPSEDHVASRDGQ